MAGSLYSPSVCLAHAWQAPVSILLLNQTNEKFSEICNSFLFSISLGCEFIILSNS